MAVENTTNIAGLDATKPGSGDPKSEGDDHLRLLKSVLQNVFAGFNGPVLVATTEAQGATANDYVLTLTPAPAAYVGSMIAIFAATHANTGAATLKINSLAAVSLLNPEGTALRANALSAGCWVAAAFDGTNFRILAGGNSQAIYDYVDQVQFQSALPAQASNAGKFLKTDGTNASWQQALQQVISAPAYNAGPIYLPGTGVMEWTGSAYAQVYTKSSIGLGNVDNTSDASKPISTATQTALNAKANLSSAAFPGAVSAGSFSTPNSVAIGGASFMTNGDVNGAAWGGNLSAYLTGQFGGKQPLGNYTTRTYSGPIAMGWNGSSVTSLVDGSRLAFFWDSLNFIPSSKKDAGNYTKDFSGSERVGFAWTGSRLALYVDNGLLGYITFGP